MRAESYCFDSNWTPVISTSTGAWCVWYQNGVHPGKLITGNCNIDDREIAVPSYAPPAIAVTCLLAAPDYGAPSSTVTGAWSLGFSHLRGTRSMVQPLT